VVSSKAATEGVAHDLVGQDALVPRLGEAAQTLQSARGFVHALHGPSLPGTPALVKRATLV